MRKVYNGEHGIGRISQEVLVKFEEQTDESLGQYVQDRAVSDLIHCGVVNVNKPKGPTSHDVTESVSNILHVRKAGHSGTLDPAVTGVLPVAVGRATRIVQAILPAGKEYICTMHLHDDADRAAIEEVMKEFTGIITQLPPVRSAVKRELRQRRVFYIEILATADRDVEFKVGCEGGTYIRKLVHDMGEKLGIGAHMIELRRTRAGCFDEQTMCTLDELEEAYNSWKQEEKEEQIRRVVQPIENAVAHLPRVWMDDAAVEPVCHGYGLAVPGICRMHDRIGPGDLVALMTLKDELVGLGRARLSSGEMQSREKGIAVSICKVFMREGTYKKPRPEQ